MQKLFLTIAFITSIAHTVVGSCMPEPHSLTELLLHDQRNRHIFQCRVERSGANFEGGYFAEVQIMEVFKKTKADLNKVTINTGGNTTAGGGRMQQGSEWLIFGIGYENRILVATVCDWFSCEKSEDPRKYYNTLRILEAYKKLVETAYSGKVIWTFKDGTVAAEGFFKKGSPNGKWHHYYPNGTLKSMVTYKNGLLHGKMTETEEYGWTKTVSKYKNGVVVAQTTTYPKGRVHSRQTMKILRNVNGFQLVQYRSWYRNGKANMAYQNWIPDHENKFQFHLNSFDGNYSHRDSSGKVLEKGVYFRGAKVGTWIETPYKSKITSLQHYPRPEQPNIDFFHFHENGKPLILGNFKDGLPDGKWQIFSDNGACTQETEWKVGSREGLERRFSADKGIEWQRVSYVNNRMEGEKLTFFEDGSIESRAFFENGLQQGAFINYAKPGEWRIQSNYLDGHLNGQYLQRDARGDTMAVTLVYGVAEGDAFEYNHELKVCHKWMGKYENGFKIGDWFVFDCDGRLLKNYRFNGKEKQDYTLHSFPRIDLKN